MLTRFAPINPGLAFSVKLKYMVFESLQTCLFFFFGLIYKICITPPWPSMQYYVLQGPSYASTTKRGQARKSTEKKKTTRGMVGAPT